MHTWTKATIGGVAAAVVVGTAGVAAATDSTTPSAPATATATAAATGTAAPSTAKKADGAKKDVAKRLLKVQHATWVTKDKSGQFVTHDAIQGTITAVSATSISVKAEDGVSMTFAVDDKTKVKVRTPGAKATDGKASDLKAGQKVGVVGTATKDGAATATAIVTGATK